MWTTGNAIKRLAQDQRAATAVEYGLICALIVVAMMASLRMVANTTSNMWSNVASEVVNNG